MREAFLATDEAGQQVNLIDSFFVCGVFFLVIAELIFINQWTDKIIEDDRKNKIRGYISSLPLDKNAYVASKYIFIGIAEYVFMSVGLVWSIACNAFCGEGIFSDMLNVMQSFLVPIFGISVLLSSLELLMYILMGTKKAKLVKTALSLKKRRYLAQATR